MAKSIYVNALVIVSNQGAQVDTSDLGIVLDIDGIAAEIYFVGKKIQLKVDLADLISIDPKKFGDSFDKKICNICHRILDVNDFDLNQNGKNNRPVRRPSCKRCRMAIDGKDMTSAQKKFWKEFKPSQEKFECPICEKVTIADVTSKVVLNHDHATGEPSGWICDSCNTGLGRFKDDPRILQKAIEYLKEAKKSAKPVES